MNVMRKHLLGLLALFALAISGCEKATTLSVPMRAERFQHIISLSPSTTEILATCTINFEGKTKACNYPDMVFGKEEFGDLKPDFEKITSRHIQFIVLDSDLYSEEDKTKLKATGAKLFEFKSTTIPDFERELLTLGSLVGNETSIQSYVDRIRREKRVAEGDAPSPRPRPYSFFPVAAEPT